MGLLCYPFSLDWETFSGAKVNKKVFYAKKMWEYLFFFDMRYEKTGICRPSMNYYIIKVR